MKKSEFKKIIKEVIMEDFNNKEQLYKNIYEELDKNAQTVLRKILGDVRKIDNSTLNNLYNELSTVVLDMAAICKTNMK